MTLDRLRAHVILSWLSCALLCTVSILAAGLKGVQGLTWAELGPTARNLSTAIAPSMLTMVGQYFVDQRREVQLTPGQRSVVLALSYAYLVAVLGITLITIYAPGVPIDQGGVNNFSWLSPWQPVVIGPIFFIYGAADRRRSPASGKAKLPNNAAQANR